MKYLKRTWVRVVVSLLGGGMISELVHVTTGDPNREMESNYSLLYALIVFLVLTILVKNSRK